MASEKGHYIILIGPPGAGKGTLVSNSVVHMPVGTHVREIVCINLTVVGIAVKCNTTDRRK